MAAPIAALNLHALPKITHARDSDIISIIDSLVERVMRAHTKNAVFSDAVATASADNSSDRAA